MHTKECVINLPSVAEVVEVDRLALTTGAQPVPERKLRRGYRYDPDKFVVDGLTQTPSEIVAPPRVKECPIQLEGVVEEVHVVASNTDDLRGFVVCFETRILRGYAEETLLASGEGNRVDPNKWRPLIMSSQKFYGLGPELHTSMQATIPERAYYTSDIDRARGVRS